LCTASNTSLPRTTIRQPYLLVKKQQAIIIDITTNDAVVSPVTNPTLKLCWSTPVK